MDLDELLMREQARPPNDARASGRGRGERGERLHLPLSPRADGSLHDLARRSSFGVARPDSAANSSGDPSRRDERVVHIGCVPCDANALQHHIV